MDWLVDSTMQTEVIVTDSELPEAVISAIAGGRKIEAIKLLRESTGLGLANAKVLIDRAARIHGPKKSSNSAITESAGPAKLVASLVAVAILAAGFYVYMGI